MGPRLLGWVLLWLLGAGPVEADVTQSPTHRITETRKKLTVTCSQNMNHDAMYWYRQDPGLGLRLIYFSRNVNFTEKGDIPDGYTVSRKDKKDFSLTLESASITQTSLYLCASSVSTARHSQLLSAQKGQPQGPHPTKRKNFPHHLCPQKSFPDSPAVGTEQCSPSATCPPLISGANELFKAGPANCVKSSTRGKAFLS